MSQFRSKSEARQAIQDMESRARSFQMQMNFPGSTRNEDRAASYRAEAARIRALLPTLPE